MACVVLPSETARLVYGYLVKENLNDIAVQFLQSSPYLMDCCQIVKSGFQFNTKLMGKDLPELLQEYSVIHNLVNNKISGLCKSSLLYKRIKLRCESLPEILELILFWQYKTSKVKQESISNNDKIEKEANSKTEKDSNNVVNSNCDYSSVSDASQVEFSENPSDNSCFNKNCNPSSVQKDSSDVETFSKLNTENYSVVENEKSNSQNQQNEIPVPMHDKKSSPCVQQCSNEILENGGKNVAADTGNANTNTVNNNKNDNETDNGNDNSNSNNNNNENENENPIHNDGNNCLSSSKFGSSTNILTIDVNSQCEDLVNDDLPTDSLVTNEGPDEYENPVKIVSIQENQSETHSLGVYSKSLAQEEDGNMSLGNSSVVFVSPDVGNVTINQEQSQIIVIPFDYYKTQNSLQNEMTVENNKSLELISNEVVSNQKNDIIFEEGSTNGSSFPSNVPLFCDRSNKSSSVDENILTENDFLKNRQLLYNLEKELYKPELPPQSEVPKESNDEVTVQTVSTPLIVVSQPLPARPPRYRAILPKKEESVAVHPVVVVHPLLENNKDLKKSNSNVTEPLHVSKTKVSRRVKKVGVLPQKTNNKGSVKIENFKEPTCKTAVEDKNARENKPEKPEVINSSSNETDIEKTNEEKENLEKTENKKNETPVFVTKRNSKRLSLSTPRRRSHIRALEFETPPKTNEEKKKSKTSPKVKVEQVKVERKSVRNTLFKSPIPEDSFKSPVALRDIKKVKTNALGPEKLPEPTEPLNELSIPIATRSPNTKLSEAWENLTGVGCVIGQNDLSKVSPTKKMWDADLRCFILENSPEDEVPEKKKVRKPEKNQKDNRKSTKKKIPPPKRIKPTPVTVSPSKISLTAKRNTYFINGNEEGSPIRSLIDDLKIVTPFKDIEAIRPTEETPLTKLLRENINTIDIDLSMINTPSFPPTPSIVITPDLDDASITGTNYYSPTKDCSKDKVLKISDYFKKESEKVNKRETKEMHEKVIDDLVSKAKEIIGLGKEIQEENTIKRRPSGKILSMVKIQMLSQCDKKLMENIPINEETSFTNNLSSQTIIGNVIEETSAKADLKVELEEKRKRALRKIKVVKENLSQTKNRVVKRGRKRKRSGNSTKSDKSKTDVSKESLADKQLSPESDACMRKESGIYHSTPYGKRDVDKLEKTDSNKKVNDKVLEDIRQLFPPFLNDAEKYPELSEKSRKKLHYVESFLKLPEIAEFINDFNENNPPKLFLKPSLRRFFHVFYKWLKHPHKRELNASTDTNALLKEYLSLFEKVNVGLNRKSKRLKRKEATRNASGLSGSDGLGNSTGSKTGFQSEDDEKECKKRESEKRKDEDIEDGVVSTLPLKKRKSTVQQVENKAAYTIEKSEAKPNSTESVSQTQNFLQDIDVDRFLSQIHGQETR